MHAATHNAIIPGDLAPRLAGGRRIARAHRDQPDRADGRATDLRSTGPAA